MRKYIVLLSVTILLLILINTSYYWEGNLGWWNNVSSLLLAGTYLVLVVVLLVQFWLAFREKLRDRYRLYTAGIVTVLLALIFVKPGGLINYEALAGKDLLTAKRGGVAGCEYTLNLKADHSFRYRGICLGSNVLSGRYIIDNDTIRFEYPSLAAREASFTFAMVKKQTYLGNAISEDILLYKSKRDTLPMTLRVSRDDLTVGDY